MTVVSIIVAAMLGAAAAITVVRLTRGPSTLDRVVAMDTLLAIVCCGFAAFAAVEVDSTPVPVLVAVSLLGFVGSACVARYLGLERP